MLGPISSTIQGVIQFTWPTVMISAIIMISFRLCFLLKNHERIVVYKELCMLTFGIYILCLFQVVTFQDTADWATNNFIPFQEILRYKITSRLFFKNVLGNMIMVFPFGLFVSYYLKAENIKLPLLLTVIASISIECVQLAIGRVFDVDDIILNCLGGILGYFMYIIIARLGEQLPKVCKKEWFLNILSVILLIGFIAGIIIIIL